MRIEVEKPNIIRIWIPMQNKQKRRHERHLSIPESSSGQKSGEKQTQAQLEFTPV